MKKSSGGPCGISGHYREALDWDRGLVIGGRNGRRRKRRSASEGRRLDFVSPVIVKALLEWDRALEARLGGWCPSWVRLCPDSPTGYSDEGRKDGNEKVTEPKVLVGPVDSNSSVCVCVVCDAGLRSALDSEELVDSHHREETRMWGFGFKGWMALSKVVVR
ncbi:hypothetical protein L1887_08740 [Cichorium endivia]|nr:hypothetical protein L1887_08740 [Cichorium endivia]